MCGGLFSSTQQTPTSTTSQTATTSASNFWADPRLQGFVNQYANQYQNAPNFNVPANPLLQGAAQTQQNVAPQYAPLYGQAAGLAQQGITGGDIQRYLSPYIQSVVDPTQAQFNRQNSLQASNLNAQLANAGALTGSQGQDAQSKLAFNQQLAQAPVIAGLYNTGYGQAEQEANANIQAQLGALQSAQGAVAGQTGANTALGNLGANIWGQQYANALAPYTLANQGATGMWQLGTLGGTSALSQGQGTGLSTTTSTPSPISSGLGVIGLLGSLFGASGGAVPEMKGGGGTGRSFPGGFGTQSMTTTIDTPSPMSSAAGALAALTRFADEESPPREGMVAGGMPADFCAMDPLGSLPGCPATGGKKKSGPGGMSSIPGGGGDPLAGSDAVATDAAASGATDAIGGASVGAGAGAEAIGPEVAAIFVNSGGEIPKAFGGPTTTHLPSIPGVPKPGAMPGGFGSGANMANKIGAGMHMMKSMMHSGRGPDMRGGVQIPPHLTNMPGLRTGFDEGGFAFNNDPLGGNSWTSGAGSGWGTDLSMNNPAAANVEDPAEASGAGQTPLTPTSTTPAQTQQQPTIAERLRRMAQFGAKAFGAPQNINTGQQAIAALRELQLEQRRQIAQNRLEASAAQAAVPSAYGGQRHGFNLEPTGATGAMPPQNLLPVGTPQASKNAAGTPSENPAMMPQAVASGGVPRRGFQGGGEGDDNPAFADYPVYTKNDPIPGEETEIGGATTRAQALNYDPNNTLAWRAYRPFYPTDELAQEKVRQNLPPQYQDLSNRVTGSFLQQADEERNREVANASDKNSTDQGARSKGLTPKGPPAAAPPATEPAPAASPPPPATRGGYGTGTQPPPQSERPWFGREGKLWPLLGAPEWGRGIVQATGVQEGNARQREASQRAADAMAAELSGGIPPAYQELAATAPRTMAAQETAARIGLQQAQTLAANPLAAMAQRQLTIEALNANDRGQPFDYARRAKEIYGQLGIPLPNFGVSATQAGAGAASPAQGQTTPRAAGAVPEQTPTPPGIRPERGITPVSEQPAPTQMPPPGQSPGAPHKTAADMTADAVEQSVLANAGRPGDAAKMWEQLQYHPNAQPLRDFLTQNPQYAGTANWMDGAKAFVDSVRSRPISSLPQQPQRDVPPSQAISPGDLIAARARAPYADPQTIYSRPYGSAADQAYRNAHILLGPGANYLENTPGHHQAVKAAELEAVRADATRTRQEQGGNMVRQIDELRDKLVAAGPTVVGLATGEFMGGDWAQKVKALYASIGILPGSDLARQAHDLGKEIEHTIDSTAVAQSTEAGAGVKATDAARAQLKSQVGTPFQASTPEAVFKILRDAIAATQGNHQLPIEPPHADYTPREWIAQKNPADPRVAGAPRGLSPYGFIGKDREGTFWWDRDSYGNYVKVAPFKPPAGAAGATTPGAHTPDAGTIDRLSSSPVGTKLLHRDGWKEMGADGLWHDSTAPAGWQPSFPPQQHVNPEEIGNSPITQSIYKNIINPVAKSIVKPLREKMFPEPQTPPETKP